MFLLGQLVVGSRLFLEKVALMTFFQLIALDMRLNRLLSRNKYRNDL